MLPNVTDPAEFGLPFDDYDTDGVMDPDTEQTASQYEKHAVDSAAESHTVPRVIMGSKTTAGAISFYDSVWGDDVSIRPTPTVNATGDVTFTWAAGGYPDINPTPARRVTRAPQFRGATVSLGLNSGGGAVAGMHLVTTTSNSVRVRTFNLSGVLEAYDFTVTVF